MPWRRVAAAALLAASLLLGGAQVRAADETPPAAPPAATTPADAAQTEQLIKTLEDPDARAKLIAQLRLLAQANAPAAKNPAAESAGAGLLRDLTGALEDTGDTILAAATDIANIGNLEAWFSTQATDPRAQDRVLRVLARLAVVLAGGLIVEWLLRRLLARPSRFVESRPTPNRWLRLPVAIARWVLDLFPIAGFAASAYALLALPFYRPGGHSELVSVAVITAYAAAAGIGTLIAAVFEPDRPALRVVVLGDAAARRLSAVARRFAGIAVWGYYTIDVLRILGLPPSGFESLMKLLGLVLAIRAIMLVIEFRRPVSAWIRGAGRKLAGDGELLGRPEIDRRLAGARSLLADIWHVLAMLYVLAAFVIWALRVEGGFEFLLRATLLTAAIFVGARLLSGALDRVVDNAFAGDEPDPVATRRRRYRRIVKNLLHLAIAVLAIMAVIESWGGDTLAWLGGETGQRVVSAVATIIAVIAVAVIVWEAVSASIERYLARTDLDGRPVARSSRARTLLPLMRNAFTVLLVLVVALIVLSEVGVNVAPLIAGAGVVGVAIGFGSQKLVQDVITGAFILFEDTIAIGDTVTIGDHSGTVEGMSIRTIRIRSGTGELHTLPFSSVSTVVNQSRGYAIFPFTIGVAYDADVDRVMAVMKEVGEALRADPAWGDQMAGPVEVFGIDKFGDLAVAVSGQIRTGPGVQVAVGREYYRLLKKRFDELGIVLPHTVYLGADGKPRLAASAVPPA